MIHPPAVKKLFKSIDESHGITRVFLSVRKRVSTVIVKLDWTDGEAGVQVVISAATDDPACAGAAGAVVNAGMSNAQQPMDENIEPVKAVRELRAKKNVVLARSYAAKRFVIAAKIGLEPEPIF